jgi:sporulation protein YlmC with PRC-barrel domain
MKWPLQQDQAVRRTKRAAECLGQIDVKPSETRMYKKLTAASLLVSGILTSTVMAQNPPPVPHNQPLGSVDPGQASPQFMTGQGLDAMRVSDLIGQAVFGPDNNSLGTVDDVVLDRSGTVAALIVQIGGVLRIGDRKVAVPRHAVQIDPANTTTTGTVPKVGTMTGVAAEQQGRNVSRNKKAFAPDRIRVTIPMDQLATAPSFED